MLYFLEEEVERERKEMIEAKREGREEERKRGREEERKRGRKQHGLFVVPGKSPPQTSTTFYMHYKRTTRGHYPLPTVFRDQGFLPYRQIRYYTNQHCLPDMNMKATTNSMKRSRYASTLSLII